MCTRVNGYIYVFWTSFRSVHTYVCGVFAYVWMYACVYEWLMRVWTLWVADATQAVQTSTRWMQS